MQWCLPISSACPSPRSLSPSLPACLPPSPLQVYGKPCTLGNDIPECVFNNPLRLSPKDTPSSLRCIRAYSTDTQGTCRVGPNKHGDACNQDGECASGRCLKELRICKGVDEGEHCEPGYPDPCQPGHFCEAQPNSITGLCRKSVSAGSRCFSSNSCERGFFCAGSDVTNRKCMSPFTVPSGTNTTQSVAMCASGNGIMVLQRPNLADSIYTCVEANSTRVGQACSPELAAPAGYECKCASNGQYKLRTVAALGLGGRSQSFRDLYSCLMGATGIMSDPCEFDMQDLEKVRYGSCGYYTCYPYYLQLVTATANRLFAPPLDQFEPYADCEVDAAKSYYKAVETTECLTLPSVEAWKCLDLAGPVSLSVGGTSALVAIIMLGVIGSYWGHMYWTAKKTGQKVNFSFKL